MRDCTKPRSPTSPRVPRPQPKCRLIAGYKADVQHSACLNVALLDLCLGVCRPLINKTLALDKGDSRDSQIRDCAEQVSVYQARLRKRQIELVV